MSATEIMRTSIYQERRVVQRITTAAPSAQRIQAKPRWKNPRATGRTGVTVGPEGVEELKAWARAYAQDRAARGIPVEGAPMPGRRPRA